ncbi:MAG: NADH-quinone oxidoreductase subunit A [Cyclobacteriaceae bacterium]|jgi:NADH-quinone oxidoreductase subunit A|nr:NADH-quinone oxidoreductase subunit A [Cyclobacteriaceae bacterium]
MHQEEYLSGFAEVLLFIVGGTLFIAVSLLISRLVRPHRPNEEKRASYESGEEPVGGSWGQFNARFYIIALIFILFEVELVLLFPWATVFSRADLIEETNGLWGWVSLVEMVLFIVILALGLVWAWAKGYLDWVKPDPRPTEYKSPIPKEMYERFR